MYPRNTGELLLDTSVPVQVRGENAYSLRLGVVVPALSYGWKLVAAFVMPVCFATVGLWLAQSPWTKGAVAAIALMLAACIGLLTHRNFRHNWRDWMRVTKAISSGKLKARVQTARRALSATHTARNAEVMGEVLRDVDAAEQNIDKVMYISQSFSVSAKEAAAAGEAQLNATEQVSDQARRLHETSVKIHQIAERFEL